MPASAHPSLTSDALAGLTLMAKEGTLPPQHLQYIAGFVQTAEPRRIVREDMGLHPLLVEADINGATLVKVSHSISGGWEQSFRRSGLEPGIEPCMMSPEMMIAQLQIPPARWSDETERFLLALSGNNGEEFSAVAVIRTRTRLDSWWVLYDSGDRVLSAMKIPGRPSRELP